MQSVYRRAVQAGQALGLTGLALVAFVNDAMAAVPASVTTALTDASTDAGTVATAVVVMGFVIWGIKYLAKGK